MAERSRVPPSEQWPSLPYEAWADTLATVHMWTQVVGKIRLALCPMTNHWWQVPLYVTARGLTTTPMPFHGITFEILFDFVDHNLLIQTSDGRTKALALYPRTVADFYRELFDVLRELDITVPIWAMPVEVPDPIPFDQDRVHGSYDAESVNRCWRVLTQVDQVLKEFRSGFLGKVSPVHFFWGAFDLAVTRFSGRRAPERPGADPVTREGYSHEVSSCGFWPGTGTFPRAVFYAYAAPEPAGFAEAPVKPPGAHYDASLTEFVLDYETVRRAPSPRRALLDFCESTYAAHATLARWPRGELEAVNGAAAPRPGARESASAADGPSHDAPAPA